MEKDKMVKTNKLTGGGRLVSWLILATVAIVVFLFCYNVVWLGDDTRYQYSFKSEDGVLLDINENTDQINTLGDIVSSQYVHSHYVNGRAEVHAMVQLFDGILGHGAFALCDAAVYVAFILMILKLCGVKWHKVKPLITVTLLAFLCFTLHMQPAFQINYIWAYTLVMVYMYLFFSHVEERRWWALFGLTLLSFLAGLAQESINIGVGGALIIYWMFNVRQYTRAQYLMTVAFGIGALILVLAPGNFSRLNETAHLTVMDSILNMILLSKALYILIVVVAVSVYKKRVTLASVYKENSFYWNVMVICIVFGLFVGIRFDRQLFGAELMAIIISVRLLRGNTLGTAWLALLGVILVAFWCHQAIAISRIKALYNDIEAQYAQSTDGEVFYDEVIAVDVPLLNSYSFPIPIKAVGSEGQRGWHAGLFVKHLHSDYPLDKPYVTLLPACLKGKDAVDIGNQVVSLGDDFFLVIQSVAEPAKFYVERSIDLPGVHRQYEPVEIELDTPIKVTPFWRAKVVDGKDYTIYGVSSINVSMN